jgi:hypothetical protein
MSAMFSSQGDAESRRKADRLVAALVGMGLPGRVEPRSALAVLIVTPDTLKRLGEPAVRTQVLALAREHGFTHIAVELAPADDADASVLRPRA